MDYSWESAAGGNGQSNYFDDHIDDYYYVEDNYVEIDDYYLNTKGGNEYTYSDKVGKAGKVGKGDYYSKGSDPYYSSKVGKGDYNGKAGKSMKGGVDDFYVRVDDYHYAEGDDYYYDGKVGKDAKNSKAGTPYYQYGEVQQHDDYTGYDDTFHFAAVSGSNTGHGNGDDFFTVESSNTRSYNGGNPSNNPYSGSGNQGRSKFTFLM